MSHLVPDVRVNKNGVAVTKHVRPDGAEGPAGRRAPFPDARVAPVASITPSPATVVERFDRVQKANSAFITRDEPTTIDPAGLAALTMLVRRMAVPDEDEDTRTWNASHLVQTGDHLAAQSILAYLDEPGRRHYAFPVMDVWDYAVGAGVMERNRLYSPGDGEASVFGFLIDFFVTFPDDRPVADASFDEMRSLGIIHEWLPEVTGAEVAEFFAERGGAIDAQLFFDARIAPAVGGGAL